VLSRAGADLGGALGAEAPLQYFTICKVVHIFMQWHVYMGNEKIERAKQT